MAELNTQDSGKESKKVRSKKASTRVDLTAMVDLAFLLITFFMLTTTLSKPQAMDLAMPDKTEKPEDQTELAIKASKSMTILLGKNNQIIYYMGLLEESEHIASDFDEIRSVMIEKNQQVLARDRSEKNKGLVVLIKPSEKSTYLNFVDILDEVKIADIKSYAIVDIFEAEVKLLEEKGLL